MSGVATAVAGGAILGAYVTSQSADKAADATGDAAAASNATQRYMYDTTRADYAPYRATGNSALNRLASMYGLEQYQDPATSGQYSPESTLVENRGGVPSVNARLYATDPVYKAAWDATLAKHTQTFGGGYSTKSNFGALEYDLKSAIESNPAYLSRDSQQGQQQGAQGQNDWSSFFDSPDYQFALEEGNRSVNQGLAARGMSNSGAAMKELTRYGQGMASQQLGNYTNRLAALAGIGQSATGSVANAGMNAANNISQGQMAAGDARASAYQQRGSAINNVINQGTGAYMLSQMQPSWGSGMQPSVYGSGGASTLPAGQAYA